MSSLLPMLNCIFLLGIGIPQEYNRLHDKGGEIIKVSLRYAIVPIMGIFLRVRVQLISKRFLLYNVQYLMFIAHYLDRANIYLKKVPQMSRNLRFVNNMTNMSLDSPFQPVFTLFTEIKILIQIFLMHAGHFFEDGPTFFYEG
jgi:hypothetical protein